MVGAIIVAEEDKKVRDGASEEVRRPLLYGFSLGADSSTREVGHIGVPAMDWVALPQALRERAYSRLYGD